MGLEWKGLIRLKLQIQSMQLQILNLYQPVQSLISLKPAYLVKNTSSTELLQSIY